MSEKSGGLHSSAVWAEVCPVCGRRTVGKVGTEQYYCSECCVEFMVKGNQVEVFEIDDEGVLTSTEGVDAFDAQ